MAIYWKTFFRYLLIFSLGSTTMLILQYNILGTRQLQSINEWNDNKSLTFSERCDCQSYSALKNIEGAPVPDDVAVPINDDTSIAKRKFLTANQSKEKDQAEEDELAQEMFRKVRISCWVMTMPGKESLAMATKQTWGKRCNVFYFVSTTPVGAEKTVLVRGTESRTLLWKKTMAGFRYAYDNHFDDTDWFVKADDNTYLIMENLRTLLLDKDPKMPVYYGCKLKRLKQDYMNGGAGYVLSKEALRRFIEESLPNPKKCTINYIGSEDISMGKCLGNAGVISGDSRDEQGKERFFPLAPERLVVPQPVVRDHWYWGTYSGDPGIEYCSDSSISFHYIDAKLMWVMEYFIYHLHPIGIAPRHSGSTIINYVTAYLNKRNFDDVTKKPANIANNATRNAASNK